MWKIVGTISIASVALFIIIRRRDKKYNRGGYYKVVETDETNGSLETDSPIPATWTSLGTIIDRLKHIDYVNFALE